MKRVTQPGIVPQALPTVDAVLLTNCDYDTLDMKSIRFLTSRFRPTFFVGRGVQKFLPPKQCRMIYPMDGHDEVKFDQLTFQFVPSIEKARRIPWNASSCNRGGFLIRTPFHTIYFAGATRYSSHFKQLRQSLESIRQLDVSVLPIGANGFSFTPGTEFLTYEEALQAHQDLESLKSIGIFHSTFPFGMQRYRELEKIKKARTNHVKSSQHFQTLQIGESLILDPIL